MAHGRPEIVMPISAMQAIILIEIHDIRNSRQVISWTRHIGCTVFDIDFKGSSDRGVIPGTRRDKEIVDLLVPLIDKDALHARIDINPSFVFSDTSRPPGVLVVSLVCLILLCFFGRFGGVG